MQITDLWGQNSALTAGKLIIPRQNLEAFGLAPTNVEFAAILAAITLSMWAFWVGSLKDADGQEIIDSDGAVLLFDNSRTDDDISFSFASRRFSSDELRLYWFWLIGFYQLQV